MWAEYEFKVDKKNFFMVYYHELYCNVNIQPLISFVN